MLRDVCSDGDGVEAADAFAAVVGVGRSFGYFNPLARWRARTPELLEKGQDACMPCELFFLQCF